MLEASYTYIDNSDEVPGALQDLRQHRVLGLDIETTTTKVSTGEAEILLVQMGTDDHVYIFDVRRLDINLLRDILEDPDIIKVGHNLLFEYEAFATKAGIQLQGIFDTMLAWRILTAGIVENPVTGKPVPAGFNDRNQRRFPYKGLAYLSNRLLGISLDKKIRQSFADYSLTDDFSTEQLQYAARDVHVLLPLYHILMDKLIEEDLVETAALEFQFLPCCAEMEMAGVRIDSEQWMKLINEARSKADKLGQELEKRFAPYVEQQSLFGGGAVNIRSQQEVKKIFHNMGYKIESTDKSILDKLPCEEAEILLEFRAYNKLVTTYGESFLNKINRRTGRLHFQLLQIGAHTGRLSSQEPNIQNIPNDFYMEDANSSLSFRSCFVADPGKVILTADYSQVELRILAEVSQDPKFINIFRSGQDLHLITSLESFKYPDSYLDVYTKVKKIADDVDDLREAFSEKEVQIYREVSKYRSMAKAINFGIVYGRGPWSIANSLGISDKEAQRLLNDYFNTYAGIRDWLKRNAHQAVVNRYARTILGRKRYFTLPPPTNELEFAKSRAAVERMGNNMTIQGCLQGHSRVLTNEGYIPIKELYESNRRPKFVWNGYKWCEYNVVNRGPAKLARLVLANGLILDCDVRHEVLIEHLPQWKFHKVTEMNRSIKVCIPNNPTVEFGNAYDDLGCFSLNVREACKELGLRSLPPTFFFWLGQVLLSAKTLKPDLLSESVDAAGRLISLDWLPSESRAFLSGDVGTQARTKILEATRRLLYGLNLLDDKNQFQVEVFPDILWRAALSHRKAFIHGFLPTVKPGIPISLTGHGTRFMAGMLAIARTCGIDGFVIEKESRSFVFHPLENRSSQRYLSSNFEELYVSETVEDTYTLEVFDVSHCFDSEGIISKNTNADIIKQAFIYLREAYRDLPETRYLFTVHDEIVSECPEEISQEVSEIKAECMRKAFREFVKSVPVDEGDKIKVKKSSHWTK